MLYNCFKCRRVTFASVCPRCGSPDTNVPLNPAFYPEFQYQTQGFFKDLLFKGQTVQDLARQRQEVLKKYQRFEKPYFVNYVHMVGRSSDGVDPAADSNLRLFDGVLQRLGFNELSTYPVLLAKLVRSTAFRFQYEEFRERFLPHIRPTLDDTLRSYIGEAGSLFRDTGYMILYALWETRAFPQLGFTVPSPDNPGQPLLPVDSTHRFFALCEQVYWIWQLDWMQGRLEHFDQGHFVSIYDIDALGGFPFEDFLARMFRALGYDVQETKRTGDQGADLFVTRFGHKTVIQAKNYAHNIGNDSVQEALAAKLFYGADYAMVVGNRYFTASAKELAAATGVQLVDRDQLQIYLDQYNRVLSGADTIQTSPN